MSLLMWGMLIVADPAAATSAPSVPIVLPAKKAKPREICRVDPADTGSHIPRHLCMSAEQWEIRSEGRSEADLKSISTH
jgi:hypothetical protein